MVFAGTWLSCMFRGFVAIGDVDIFAAAAAAARPSLGNFKSITKMADRKAFNRSIFFFSAWLLPGSRSG